MLRDTKTTYIAEMMRCPPLGDEIAPAAKAAGIERCREVKIRSKIGSVRRAPKAALAIMLTSVSRAAWLYDDSPFALRA